VHIHVTPELGEKAGFKDSGEGTPMVCAISSLKIPAASRTWYDDAAPEENIFSGAVCVRALVSPEGNRFYLIA